MKKLIVILFLSIASVAHVQENLTVFGAIEKALNNNYQIKLVTGNYEVSSLQNSWGQAGLWPTFSINVSNAAALQDNTNNPATFFPGIIFNDNLQASLSMSWVVFNGFGVRINKARFDQLEAQTKGNAVVVIESTIYDVIMAYYTAVVQDRKLEIMADLLDYSKEKLAYHQLKNDVGVSTGFDLLEFENQVLADSSNYVLQALAVRNAQRNLNLLMAENEEIRYTLTDSVEFTPSTENYSGLKDKMLANNQNLKNQFINYELQELNLRAKKSAYYPVVSVNLSTTPSVGFIRLIGEDGSSTSTSSWSHNGNVSVRYDLFQGWNRKRNTEIATIQRDMSGLEIDKLQQELSHQLKGIHELYDVRSQVEKMSLQRLEHASMLWKLGQEKYDLGIINIFNLNDIKLSYEQTVLTYYDRLYELLQSHYDLMRITGGIAQQFNISANINAEE